MSPGFTATKDNRQIGGIEATFGARVGDVLFIRSGDGDDHKRLHNAGTVSDIRIDRIPGRPTACDQPAADTPESNFEVFVRTWSENYISFDLKGTDWARVILANRPKITAQTTPSQLFDVLAEMIKPFGDAHTYIVAPSLKRQFFGFRPATDRVTKSGLEKFQTNEMTQLLSVTERAYLHGPLRKFCNGKIAYGHIDRTTGYLRIVAFSGYTKRGDYASGLSALEAALDTIFSDTSLKGLVIDVRVNFGGDDPYGLEIAERLANMEYVAYTKEAVANPGEQRKWTPSDTSWVRPSSRPGFRGPVVELIGPLTISAGETFTQALMGRTPHIIRIGENTQGVFSDVLNRRLPNGWRFGLPNEVYRTPEGNTFDGGGIPPDVAIRVFADDDVKTGRDPAVAKALEILMNAK